MAREVVGRDEELASVRAFVDGASDGSAALVLEGEAGIGKSTLWLAGVDYARSKGLRALVSRPAEAERSLAYAGLGDLFEHVLDDVLPRLTAPRRRVLEATFLVEDATSEVVDPRALGVAVRDALQALTDQGPVVVAVDDLQWLDAASADALAFAWRRLGASPVLMLLARRLGEGEGHLAIEQAAAAGELRRLSLGPLSVGALHSLLRDRLDRVFPRQTLLRIHEQSGGNPFFALELARAANFEIDPTQPIPVPQTLDGLVRTRLAGLPARTRDALALAAALGAPSESLLVRVGVAPEALEPALDARVVERENGTLRFTHPLLSSALYTSLGAERPKVHRRIAEIVEDPLVRARHLALGTEGADGGVAAVLDEAVGTATDRGAAALAAELAEHSRRLTPAEARPERRRRALAAARAQHAAGEWVRARAMVNELLSENDIGPLRAEALILLAELEGLHRATALLEEALREATSRPALQAAVHCRLAWATRFQKGFVGALEHARAALDLADRLDDDALRIDALLIFAFLGRAVGDPDAPKHAQRAYELAQAGNDEVRLTEAVSTLADAFERTDVDSTRALLEKEHSRWRDRDELRAASILFDLSWVELWAGRWELAADHADRAYEIKTQYALEVPWDHLPIAVVAAHRGQHELARTHSERALRLGEEQIGLHTPVHLGTMGIVALQSGDPRTAAEWFAEAEAQTTRLGWHGPGHRWWIPDHVEALLELGHVDEAIRVLDGWEADARRVPQERVLAHVVRCQGLVASARGDVAAATGLLEDAVAQHEAVGDAFGRARALLALGVVRRRQRQKRAARDAIDAALAAFEQLGAATWVEKARAELGRIGGRTRVEGLTPAERRVAGLVAQGRTNKEVAAALYLGERTVETHLSHVYAKLGVRSRAELARRYRPDEQDSGGVTISS
jgi:DNA-binding CsgD family transcriptional regulator